MQRRSRTDDELRAAADHLAYEVEMMWATAAKLARNAYPSGTVEANALVQSFALHARNLLHFLFPDHGQIHDDDVLAEDYFQSADRWGSIRGALPSTLTQVRGRVGKEIAHLSYQRLKVTPQSKGWQLAIAPTIDAIVQKFRETADRLDFGSKQRLLSAKRAAR